MITGIEADAAVVPLAHQHRRHQRVDLCFKVRFRVLREEEALATLTHIQDSGDEAVAHGADVDSNNSYTNNVSSGGLGLCGQLSTLRGHALAEGDILKIEIQPRRSESIVRCLGRVAWVEIEADAAIFRAGVSFVAVNPTDLEKVRVNDLVP
jgi:hypothetical protein